MAEWSTRRPVRSASFGAVRRRVHRWRKASPRRIEAATPWRNQLRSRPIKRQFPAGRRRCNTAADSATAILLFRVREPCRHTDRIVSRPPALHVCACRVSAVSNAECTQAICDHSRLRTSPTNGLCCEWASDLNSVTVTVTAWQPNNWQESTLAY